MEHGPHATIADLLWPALNFSIFVVVLIRFLRGPIREYFRGRTERLRGALEVAAQARREAAALEADLRRDLADLPAVRERMKADLRVVAERQCAVLLEMGRQAAGRIRADARLVAEQEMANARQTLRVEVVSEAVREAAGLIRANLRPEDQDRFVRDFVSAAGATA